MRSLKFRAWDIKNNRFVNIVRLVFDQFGALDYAEVVFKGKIYKLYPSEIILEQDTGLKDKNGKEICEGDIVNVIGIGIAQVIDSLSGEWMLYYRREPDEINSGFVSVIPKNKPSGLWKTSTTSYIEVIGNIHENPELLGVE